MEATDKIVCGPVDAINSMIATSFQIACIQIVSHFLLFLFKLLGQAGPIADVPNMKDITLEDRAGHYTINATITIIPSQHQRKRYSKLSYGKSKW
ncbi:hypothetical protein SLE2022_176740 [Rubroshorea leprosula]